MHYINGEVIVLAVWHHLNLHIITLPDYKQKLHIHCLQLDIDQLSICSLPTPGAMTSQAFLRLSMGQFYWTGEQCDMISQVAPII